MTAARLTAAELLKRERAGLLAEIREGRLTVSAIIARSERFQKTGKDPVAENSPDVRRVQAAAHVLFKRVAEIDRELRG